MAQMDPGADSRLYEAEVQKVCSSLMLNAMLCIGCTLWPALAQDWSGQLVMLRRTLASLPTRFWSGSDYKRTTRR